MHYQRLLCHDGAIAMERTQITLDSELQRRARQRASDLGISFAEYVRQLIERDLSHPNAVAGIEALFDQGNPVGSNIAKHKDEMIGGAVDFEAADSLRRSKQLEILNHFGTIDFDPGYDYKKMRQLDRIEIEP
jgi:hypothetical protein